MAHNCVRRQWQTTSSSPFIPLDQVCHNSSCRILPPMQPTFPHRNPMFKNNPHSRAIVERTILQGKFEILNEPLLREKANRKSDPRYIFYEAMLECETYEAYSAATRGITAFTGKRKRDRTTGRDETLYARRKKWINDDAEF